MKTIPTRRAFDDDSPSVQKSMHVHDGDRPRLYDAQGYSLQRAIGYTPRIVRRTDDP
jgi:hypothetical protein